MKKQTIHFFVDRRRPAEVQTITPSEIAEAYVELVARQTAAAHLQQNAQAYTERLRHSNKPSTPRQIAATKRTVADDIAEVYKLAAQIADLPDCPLPTAWVIVYPMPGEPVGKWAAEACVSGAGELGCPQIRATQYSSAEDALQALREIAAHVAHAYPTIGKIDHHSANRLAAIQAVESGRIWLARTAKNCAERDSGELPRMVHSRYDLIPDGEIIEASLACEIAGVTREALRLWRNSGRLEVLDRGGSTGGHRYLAGAVRRAKNRD